MTWRKHKIGYVSGLYSLTPLKGDNGHHITKDHVPLYDVRCNGMMIRLSPCSLDEAKAWAMQHKARNAN